MKRYHHSKSGLFLLELLINLLLFCLLCGCSLTFFLKSHRLSEDAVLLQQAVSITSSVAGLYESGDGSFALLEKAYEPAELTETVFYLYLDKDCHPCPKEKAYCFLRAERLEAVPNGLQIDFYNQNGEISYSIQTRCFTPYTLEPAKEETAR